jgi:cell division septation protein DedD
LIVVGVVAFLLGRGGGDNGNRSAALATPPAVTQTTTVSRPQRTQHTPRKTKTAPPVPAPAPPPVSAPTSANGGWPAGTSAYTVIIASQSTSSQASEFVQRARAAGLPNTGTLYSSDHSSLRPGYWVAFTGVYSSEAEANGARDRARAAGFGVAYTRYVSAN